MRKGGVPQGPARRAGDRGGGEIAYLNAEQAKEPAAASCGVRMDVFAREGSRVFDIEMQVSPKDAAYRDEMLAEFGLERAE